MQYTLIILRFLLTWKQKTLMIIFSVNSTKHDLFDGITMQSNGIRLFAKDSNELENGLLLILCI